MPNWFYIDTNGQYQGPVDSQQLKSLAVQGVVSPETLLITDGGKKGKAGQLRGLFDAPAHQPATSAPVAAPNHAGSSLPMENTQYTDQEVVDQIYDYATNLMINEGKSATETVHALIDQGLSTETASIVVANIEQQINAVKKSSGSKNMIWGAIWCIGGTVVTVATFSAAAEGGRFVLAWGAILFGGIQFLYGLAEYFTNSNHT